MRWWEMITQRTRAPALMERMFARFDARPRLAGRPGGAEALRRATIRCMACSDTEACEEWLQQEAEAEAPPPFCRNAGLIQRLRREGETLH